MNARLHAVTDHNRRPIRFFVTAGQASDDTGAAAKFGSLPDAVWLLTDRGRDADWFRNALADRGIRPCIPPRTSRKAKVKYDKRRYKRRYRIECMFGRLMGAILDRLTHHVHILEMNGESFRLRQSRKDKS